MADITVPVPNDRIAEFYRFFGLWLDGELGANPVSDSRNWNRNGEPWTDDEKGLEDATWLWKQLTGQAKGLFGLLIDNPGQRFTGSEIAETVGIKNGTRGVAGTLAWPGRYCIQRGRRLPTEFHEDLDAEVSFYWMEPATAALFNKARIASGS